MTGVCNKIIFKCNKIILKSRENNLEKVALKRWMATIRLRLRTGTKSTDKILEKNCPNRVKGEERPKTLPILDVTARNPNV